MVEFRDRGSVRASEKGIQILKSAKAAKRTHDDKPWSYTDIEIESGVSAKTIGRFFKGKEHIDDSKARSICQVLGVEFKDVVELHIANNPDNQDGEINWREMCRELLNNWKGLTTNSLTRRDGVCFKLDEIFVPLGVVERRQRPKHSQEDGHPEQGSELYEEKVTPISQKDFFEQVLWQRQSKQSQGKRIAIIGEPGAGKTTQLHKIGDWILEETDEIPIWIPLAALEKKSLSEYLLKDWLQTATSELEIPQQYRDALGQLLKTKKVWLLLDGVDEMAVSDALYQIATQMREGWLQHVRVVLTCRLNVWDMAKNDLYHFDVFRNLDFDYPGEVHQFINNWFGVETESKEKLKSALEQPGKARIRDMVKSPLRLTLLCYSWQLRQGELPETKAGLYEWFVNTFYEWNRGKVPLELDAMQRKELNYALGELAKAAINQNSSRFRLPEKFINQFLGNVEDEDSLFKIALQLGWINRVGVAEENSFENVYSFFHSTFQEYFAALVIEDWNYFLPSYEDTDESEDNSLEEYEYYRIFEPQWIEVILLWIGRPELDKDVKQAFVDTLISFQDECIGCYDYRAFFAAVRMLSEFEEYDLANETIEQLVEYAFDYNIDSEQTEVPDYITEFAKSAIPTTNQKLLFSTIERIYKLIPDSVQLEIVELLIDIHKINSLLIEMLEHLINHSETEDICLRASTILFDNDIVSLSTVKSLENLVNYSHDDSIRSEASTNLLRYDPQNSIATTTLIKLASEKYNVSAIEGLCYAYSNTSAIETLEHIIEELEPIIKAASEEDDDDDDDDDIPEYSGAYWNAQDSLYQIKDFRKSDDFHNVPTANHTFDLPDDEYINCRILEDLEELNHEIFGILESSNGEMVNDKYLAKYLLDEYIENFTANNEDVFLAEARTQTEIEISKIEQIILCNIEKLLGGKNLIIGKILDIIYSTEDDQVFYDTLHKLEEIGENNEAALNGVIKLAIEGTRSHRLNMVIYALAYIGGQNNLIVIDIFLRIIITPQKKEIEWIGREAVESLKEILQDIDLMYKVVAWLGKHISDDLLETNSDMVSNCFSVLWHCSQYLSYPEFFDAWHDSHVVDELEMPIE
jgi:GTPase SAR1 family protein